MTTSTLLPETLGLNQTFMLSQSLSFRADSVASSPSFSTHPTPNKALTQVQYNPVLPPACAASKWYYL